jgi:antitoxin CptB
MYNTLVVSKKLEIIKKKLLYRASYRGTKEMDILLSSFVNKYINKLNESNLVELEEFLNYEDEILLNYYNHDVIDKKISLNEIFKLFKSHKV